MRFSKEGRAICNRGRNNVCPVVGAPRCGVRERSSTLPPILRRSMRNLIRGRRSAASLPMGAALILLIFLSGSALAQQQQITLDETARFLAGLAVEGPLAPLTQTDVWDNHAAAMDQAWMKKEHFQLG